MKTVLPCAVYTRKSSEDGLEQGFNSLDAQREACEAFILSQKAHGWGSVEAHYDDGGFSGGNAERPALKRLLADVVAGLVRIVVVYKVDRLTRSLADFAKLVELFDAHKVSFVSVTQQFNTTSSMGRLTLNVLLSFAQFEREVTGERIRDKISASKRKGLWMGGMTPLGYLPHERTLVIHEPQAERIRAIFKFYLQLGCVRQLQAELTRLDWVTPQRVTRQDKQQGGKPFSRGHLYRILGNPVYIGQISHKGAVFPGQHPAIVDPESWKAVQDKLRSNVQGHRTRATARNPSLLTGLMFDSAGQRLTPTHAKKGERRYRYYVSRALNEASPNPGGETQRWPAQELEDAVLQALGSFLMDKQRLIALISGRGSELSLGVAAVRDCLTRAAALAKQLTDGNVSERIAALQRVVKRITVRSNRIEIEIRIGAVGSADALNTPDGEPDPIIEIPVTLKRCGMAVRLLVRGSDHRDRRPDPKLMGLIGKAHDWFARLSSGRSASVAAIAAEEKVSSPYVTRVVHLAFLAPDIVAWFHRGEQPPDFTRDRLIRMVPLPLDWKEQRKLFEMRD